MHLSLSFSLVVVRGASHRTARTVFQSGRTLRTGLVSPLGRTEPVGAAAGPKGHWGRWLGPPGSGSQCALEPVPPLGAHTLSRSGWGWVEVGGSGWKWVELGNPTNPFPRYNSAIHPTSVSRQ